MFAIHNATYTFDSGAGIHDVTFCAERGSINAIIGPNGAGKSTLFNTMNGLLKPQEGRYLLDGVSLFDAPISRLGFLPERDFLIDAFTVTQMIEFICAMKSIDDSDGQIGELLRGFSLWERRDAKIKKLSEGMKKRLKIICASLGQPSLLVLDEPLNALDIQSVLFFKELLIKWRAQGMCILLSSHILELVDEMADQALFLADGRLVYSCKKGADEVFHTEELYKEMFMNHKERKEHGALH